MKWKIVLYAVYVCLFSLFIQCGPNSDIILEMQTKTGFIYGIVMPPQKEARVILVQNNDTIARTIAEITTGNFIFKDIPYGAYTIIAISGQMFAHYPVYLVSPNGGMQVLHLRHQADLINSISINHGDTLKTKRNLRDTLITLELQPTITIVSDSHPISIVPEFLMSCTKISTVNKQISFNFHLDSLFKNKKLNLSIRVDVHTKDTVFLRKDTISLDYCIDSTGLDSIITSQLVDSIYPYFPISKNVHLEDTVSIKFHYRMNQESVQRGISLTPPIPMNFFWINNRINCVPIASFSPDTHYVFTISSSAMTADSQKFRTSVKCIFTTEKRNFFSSYWPLDSSVHISLYPEFRFESSYWLDEVLLKNAFSIQPVVDSLKFITVGPGVIEVEHAPLLADTAYLITIKGTLTSKKNVPLGKDLSIWFRTKKSGKK